MAFSHFGEGHYIVRSGYIHYKTIKFIKPVLRLGHNGYLYKSRITKFSNIQGVPEEPEQLI